jgi:predicted nucleic acid-binding protein
MTALCFLDTNILLYTHDERDERKFEISQHIVSELTRERSFVISIQVVNEYYNVATSKPSHHEHRSVYRDNARRLRHACTAPLDLEVAEAAWSLQEITNYAWWDLLIIASALKAGCRYLLTEDMTHGHEFGDLTIVNPFFADFDEVVEKLGIQPPLNFSGEQWP